VVKRALRFLAFALVMPGCGFIVGLRTDYEVTDASIDGLPMPDVAMGEATSMMESGSDANAMDVAMRPDVCDASLATCCNGIKDGLETDTDCGGGECPKCPNGSTCAQNTDCLSGNCAQQGVQKRCKQ
jgi:hypothetical protein